MPKVVSGVLDRFADHAIDVPVPDNAARHGVPSACGECHADRAPAALAADLRRLWPAAAARQARRLRLADAFDPATAAASAGPLAAVVADAAEAPALRGAAALLLARRFPAEAAGPIGPLLAATDALLRAKAAEALGVARVRAAAGRLAALADDPALRVRVASAAALAALGDPRGEVALHALAEAPATARLLEPHLALGPALARRGELDAARRELEQVAELAPYYGDALVQLAEVALRLGDRAAAEARVAQTLSFDPFHAAARALAARLAAAPQR
jgi:hypothetical protein